MYLEKSYKNVESIPRKLKASSTFTLIPIPNFIL